MKLQILKPRISMIGRLKVNEIAANPIATPRTRGRAWMRTRAKWLTANPLCVMCEQHGRVRAATEVDHIVRLADGGKDDDSNYQSLCYDCHKAKTADEAKGKPRL